MCTGITFLTHSYVWPPKYMKPEDLTAQSFQITQKLHKSWYKQDFIKQISPFQRALNYHYTFLYEGDIVECRVPPAPPPPKAFIYFLLCMHKANYSINTLLLASLLATGGYSNRRT